ncbi:MAG: DUF4416 family protein [Candidatus Kaelpia imicola]|nr:DUF4416 family protein [Candidatus Kaelpia imicola]
MGRGMGLLREARPVKLIIAMLVNKVGLFERAERVLVRKFGAIDYESRVLDFNVTNYYKDEMGDNLLRKFLSFKRLISPGRLREIKLYTNRLEKRFMSNNNRDLNLDPGYINEGKVVLASTKDNLQRFYLGRGVYGEVTLYLKGGEYQDLVWTYPDYKSPEYKKIFSEIRVLFRKQIGR